MAERRGEKGLVGEFKNSICQACVSDACSECCQTSESCLFTVWHSTLRLGSWEADRFRDAAALYTHIIRGLHGRTHSESDSDRILYVAARGWPDSAGALGAPSSVLVQTLHAPTWRQAERVVSGYLVQRVSGTINRGDNVRLKVVASPVVSRSSATGRLYRQVLWQEGECRNWFTQRLENSGCKVKASKTKVGELCHTSQRGHKVPLRELHASVRITEPARFASLLTRGMGRNRAWGAGLVQVLTN
ncbi:type I-E CRISPR-associated protein Cas6/Cse3/CasE [Streptomyces sp. NPDC005813]|uniref:type I-E CRISPR-associated protein Cas6/Cse3/CasE n=1 Tax=Streptomyces sp. NPDC005813 TaxID=3155592 RepID=UPI0033D68E59